MAMGQVVFHCWDHREQANFAAIQKGIAAVYNGITTPCIVDVSEMLDWDQYTVAICSVKVSTERMRELLEEWRLDEDNRGDCSRGKIVPLEI